MKPKIRRCSGFTLLELIVVLVILGVLAALLLPALTGYIGKGHESAATAECRQCVVAAKSVLAKKYAADPAATLTIAGDGADILALAGLETEPSKEFVEPGFETGSGEVLHVYCHIGSDYVTYCAHPETCTAHSRNFTLSNAPVTQVVVNTLLDPKTTAGAILDAYFKKYNLKNGVSLNSALGAITAPGGTPLAGDGAKVMAALKEQLGDSAVQSFRVYRKQDSSGKDISYNIFISSVDISTIDVANLTPAERTVSVTKYDQLTGTYTTGTVVVASATTTKTTYNILDGATFQAS